MIAELLILRKVIRYRHSSYTNSLCCAHAGSQINTKLVCHSIDHLEWTWRFSRDGVAVLVVSTNAVLILCHSRHGLTVTSFSIQYLPAPFGTYTNCSSLKLAYVRKLLCVESDTSRNTRSANNRCMVIVRFPRLKF